MKQMKKRIRIAVRFFPVEDCHQQSPRAAKLATSILHVATRHEQQRHIEFLLLNARGI